MARGQHEVVFWRGPALSRARRAGLGRVVALWFGGAAGKRGRAGDVLLCRGFLYAGGLWLSSLFYSVPCRRAGMRLAASPARPRPRRADRRRTHGAGFESVNLGVTGSVQRPRRLANARANPRALAFSDVQRRPTLLRAA